MLHLRWLVIVALAVPFRAEATLIERDLIAEGGSVTYSDAITYDTDTRLEWLDLPLTQGLSVNAVRAHPLAGGWRHPMHGEVCGLMEGRTGPIRGCSGSRTDTGSYEGIAELLELLGVTLRDSYQGIDGWYLLGIYETGWALIGIGPDIHAEPVVQEHGALVAPDSPFPPDASPAYYYGHFLVRVPELRSALLLLVAGFALMGRRAR